MPDVLTQHNVASLGTLQRLTDHSTATAGGSGDATSVTGNTIDRMGFSTGSMPRSAVMGVAYEATLASGKTISFGYAVQDSADSSTWADYQTATFAVVSTGASGGSTNKGTFEVPVDLNNARRYIRFNYQPDLSATGTDTAYADGVGFLAGFDRLPAPTADTV
jgi:hypothetical protein